MIRKNLHLNKYHIFICNFFFAIQQTFKFVSCEPRIIMKLKLIVNDLLNKLKTMLMLDKGPKICEIGYRYRIFLHNKNCLSW